MTSSSKCREQVVRDGVSLEYEGWETPRPPESRHLITQLELITSSSPQILLHYLPSYIMRRDILSSKTSALNAPNSLLLF